MTACTLRYRDNVELVCCPLNVDRSPRAICNGLGPRVLLFPHVMLFGSNETLLRVCFRLEKLKIADARGHQVDSDRQRSKLGEKLENQSLFLLEAWSTSRQCARKKVVVRRQRPLHFDCSWHVCDAVTQFCNVMASNMTTATRMTPSTNNGEAPCDCWPLHFH